MKFNIRRDVFETNSSSCHSITISNNTNNKLDYNQLNKYIDDFGVLTIELNEFGWGIASYNDANNKLAYLCLTALHSEKIENGWFWGNDQEYEETTEKFKQTESYNRIFNVLVNFIDIKDIEFKNEGYIDHQSLNDYGIDGLLNSFDVSSLEEFIFNKKYIINTDNDN